MSGRWSFGLPPEAKDSYSICEKDSNARVVRGGRNSNKEKSGAVSLQVANLNWLRAKVPVCFANIPRETLALFTCYVVHKMTV